MNPLNATEDDMKQRHIRKKLPLLKKIKVSKNWREK